MLPFALLTCRRLVVPYSAPLLYSVLLTSLGFVALLWVVMCICAYMVFGEQIEVSVAYGECVCVCSVFVGGGLLQMFGPRPVSAPASKQAVT